MLFNAVGFLAVSAEVQPVGSTIARVGRPFAFIFFHVRTRCAAELRVGLPPHLSLPQLLFPELASAEEQQERGDSNE